MINKKLQQFIDKSELKHKKKYKYDKVNYINSLTKVCITCPIHGDFWQTPQAHVRGDGCPKCALEQKKNNLISNNETFIQKAQQKHKKKYKYDKVNYINSSTKVCITCPIHGDFWMTPSAHLNGQQCPKCQGKGLNTDEIIQKCNLIHNNQYDYSLVKFSKMHEKVPIICPKHGVFMQSMSKHISKKQGCPVCAIENRSNNKRTNINDVIKKANLIHHNQYDYSLIKFNNINDKVDIICPKHGIFTQRLYDHLHGTGCPHCTHVKSNDELEIFHYIQNLCPDAINGDKTILNGKELDIFIPSKNIAIEYNGLRWHSEYYGKDQYYHLNKLEECLKKGIFLIQIFEDEYKTNKTLIYHKLNHILKCDNHNLKIMGRKCVIQSINYNDAISFLQKYHIQGGVPSTVYLGAFYGHEMIGVMTFLFLRLRSVVRILICHVLCSGCLINSCRRLLFGSVRSHILRHWLIAVEIIGKLYRLKTIKRTVDCSGRIRVGNKAHLATIHIEAAHTFKRHRLTIHQPFGNNGKQFFDKRLAQSLRRVGLMRQRLDNVLQHKYSVTHRRLLLSPQCGF